MADLHAVEPDRVLTVRCRAGLIQLHHLLDAHPLIARRLHVRVVEQVVAPVVAVADWRMPIQ